MGEKFYVIIFSFSGTLQFSPRGLKPSFNFSIGNHLGKHTMGYLSFTSNFTAREVNDVRDSTAILWNCFLIT